MYHQPRLVTADMNTLRSAALAGVGVVQLPLMMVTEQLAEGTLVRLLPDWSVRHEIIHAVYPSGAGCYLRYAAYWIILFSASANWMNGESLVFIPLTFAPLVLMLMILMLIMLMSRMFMLMV